MLKHLLFCTFYLYFIGCSNSYQDVEIITTDQRRDIYYGDIANDAIIHLDIERMVLQNVLPSGGKRPYEITYSLSDALYIINRGDTNIETLQDDRIGSHYNLAFQPRSIALNKETKRTLISSVSKPAATLLEESDLYYSDSSYTPPTSFGGEYATGHPYWVDAQHFLLLDRSEKTVELYEVGTLLPLDKIFTSSSVHHVISQDATFYGVLEGEQNASAPGVITFSVKNNSFHNVQEQLLDSFAALPEDFHKSSWGAHHLALHPNREYIYIGSNEGNVFVLKRQDLSLVETFKAGKGVGHFSFYNNILITTNHHDTFKSFHDVSDPEQSHLITELLFAKEEVQGKIMQSHTTHIINDHLYFIFNDANESRFYDINLNNYTINGYISLKNRYCLMGAAKARADISADEM